MTSQGGLKGSEGDEEHHDEAHKDQGEDDPAEDLDQLGAPGILVVYKAWPLLKFTGQLCHWGH